MTFRSESGQGSTEYMLVISVIVVAVTAGAYLFVPQFRTGSEALAGDVSRILATGEVGGVGLNRGGGGSTNSANGSGAGGANNGRNPTPAVTGGRSNPTGGPAAPLGQPIPIPAAPMFNRDSGDAVSPGQSSSVSLGQPSGGP